MKNITRYFNMRGPYGVETVDEFDSQDFKSRREFRKELRRMVLEYSTSGMPVYISSRCTKDWRNK